MSLEMFWACEPFCEELSLIFFSDYAVERRDRTIYRRMRDYLRVLCRTEGLTTSVIPIGDGAAVTIKEQDTVEIPAEGSLSQGE